MSEDLSSEEMLAEVSGKETAPAASTTGEIAAPATPQEFEYTIQGGKKIKESLDMVLKRAGMGYHYAQQMNVLNQEREKYKGYDERIQGLSRWEEYDKFAKDNPQWAEHWQNAWQSRTKALESNQGIQEDPRIADLERKLSELSKFKDEFGQFSNERKLERTAREDEKFSGEITHVAKQYGVDMSQADEQGKSLEYRTLEHMKAMGLDGSKPGHFHMAFRDLNFDNLLSRQKEKTLETQTKDQIELKKAGIRDITRAPKKSEGLKIPVQSMSWNEVRDAALQDYRKQVNKT